MSDLTPESNLAAALGLSRAELGKTRGTAKEIRAGEHWSKDGNLIVWTPAGVAALQALLESKKSGEKNGGGGLRGADGGDDHAANPGPSQAHEGAGGAGGAGAGLGWGAWMGAQPGQDALAAVLAGAKKETPRPAPQVLVVVRLVTNRSVVVARAETEEERQAGRLGAQGQGKPGEEVTVRGLRNNQLLAPRQRIYATPDPLGPVWNWYGPHPKRKGQILVPIPQPGVPARAPQPGGRP